MTTARGKVLAFLAALAGGCAAGASTGTGGKSGGHAGSYASGGAGGGGTPSADAAAMNDAGRKPDAGSIETLLSNYATDAPIYLGDACASCSGGNAGSKGGSGGSAGSSTSGGLGGSAAGGRTSGGGALGSGGSLSGGASGKGGSPGSGGFTSALDAGPGSDAPVRVDGGASGSGGADAAARDGGTDVSSGPDTLPGGDLRPADSFPPDATPACVAHIEAVVPVTDSFKDFPLVAGPNQRVVLRAKVISGGPAAGASWTWQATRDGPTPVPALSGTQDPATAAFSLPSAGNYSFTVTDKTGACSDTVQNAVASMTACSDCGRTLNLRFAPPPSANIPVQSVYYRLTGSAPFAQNFLPISSGVAVQVSPSVGTTRVPSYVRINSSGGDLVADGLSDPQAGGFATRLLDQGVGTLLKYDVLVVPLDGSSNGLTVGATAPQLFTNLTPANINTAAFSLGGGFAVAGTVTGATLTSAGPIADVRVMLTNQNPAAAAPSKLIFSSVGQSDAQGNYLLHAQPGTYWVSLSPPVGSVWPEALAPLSVTLSGDTTMDFKWNAVTTSTLSLMVLDAAGNPSAQTRVRLTSAQSLPVGTLTFGSSGGASTTQTANGNVQVESITSTTGVATFANLPDGTSYDALLVPAALGPYSATTTLSLNLPAGGAPTLPASLLAQGRITGQLTAGTGSTTLDWTQVEVIAYDRSNDSPEVPLAVVANTDGTFSMGVSPGRSYVLMVVPDASTGLARTFVGPGPIQATEFSFTQNVQSAMTWSSTVMDGAQNGLAETAMQVFCIAGWPYCVDPTLPLAETTSGDGGAFQLALPDPATR